MDRLRAAIVAVAREDMFMIDELASWTAELVEAFNDYAAVERGRGVHIKPIDTDDLEDK